MSGRYKPGTRIDLAYRDFLRTFWTEMFLEAHGKGSAAAALAGVHRSSMYKMMAHAGNARMRKRYPNWAGLSNEEPESQVLQE